MSDKYFIDEEPSVSEDKYFIDEGEESPSRSWGDTFGDIERGLEAGLFRIGTGAGGAIESGQDALRSLGLDTGNFGRDVREQGQSILSDYEKLNQESDGGLGYDVAQGALPLTTAAFSPGAWPALLGMGIQTYGEKYGQFKDEGVEPLNAAVGAGGNAVVQSAINATPLKFLTKPGAGLVGRTLGTSATNTLLSPIGTAFDIIQNSSATGVTPSAEQIGEDLIRSGEVGAITGALAAPVGEIAARGRIPQPDTRINALVDEIVAQVPSEPTAPLALPPPTTGGDGFTVQDAPAPQPQVKDFTSPPILEGAPPISPEGIIPGDTLTPRAPETQTMLETTKQELANSLEMKKLQAIQKETTEKVKTNLLRVGHELKGTFPDLSRTIPREEFNAALNEERPGLILSPDDVKAEMGKTMAERLKSQRGAVRNPFAKKGEDGDIEPLAASQKYFEGEDSIGGQLRGWYRQKFSFMRTLGNKFPQAREAYDAGSDYIENANLNAANLFDEARPFMSLSDPKRLNELLIAERYAARKAKEQGGSVPSLSDEFLTAKGFSPEEIGAYRAVEKWRESGLEMYKRGLMADAERIKEPEKKQEFIDGVNQYVEGLRADKYVPFSRERQRFQVSAKGDFSFHETKESALAKVNELRANGIEAKVSKVPMKDLDATMASIPPELRGAVSAFQVGGGSKRGEILGFSKHMQEANLTAGFDADIRKNIAEYNIGVSRWASWKEAQVRLDSILEGIDPKKEPSLYKRIKQYREDLVRPNPKTDALLRVTNLWNLAGVPSSAFINGTQSLTTTLPYIAKFESLPKATATWGRAIGKTFDYVTSQRFGNNAFAMKNPGLSAGLDRANKSGVIDAQAIKEMAGFLESGSFEKSPLERVNQLLMTPFAAVEHLNRTQAFVAGYDIATRKGMSGDAAYQFASEFVKTTQFDQTKANRPQIAQGGLGRLATQYKLFGGNYLRFLRDNVSSGDYKVVALSLAPMLALGGAFALPFARDLDQIAKTLGFDTKAALREFVGNKEFAEGVMYGIPPSVNMNLSAAIGGQQLPDFDTDPLTMIGGVATGATGTLASRAIKAKKIYSEEHNPGAALEAIAPRFLRGMIRDTRWREKGRLEGPTGKVLLNRDPSFGETLQNYLGFTPNSVAREQERNFSNSQLKEQYLDTGKINQKIGDALAAGDRERARALIEEGVKNGIKPDEGAIMRRLVELKNPDAAALLQIPKRKQKEFLERQQIYK